MRGFNIRVLFVNLPMHTVVRRFIETTLLVTQCYESHSWQTQMLYLHCHCTCSSSNSISNHVIAWKHRVLFSRCPICTFMPSHYPWLYPIAASARIIREYCPQTTVQVSVDSLEELRDVLGPTNNYSMKKQCGKWKMREMRELKNTISWTDSNYTEWRGKNVAQTNANGLNKM